MPPTRAPYYVFLSGLLIVVAGLAFWQYHATTVIAPVVSVPLDTSLPTVTSSSSPMVQDDAYWKKVLTPEQYYILREKGTETPFSSPLDMETRPGTYYSAGCNEPVFRSEQKYDSGTGWPSFWAPITSSSVVLQEDDSLGMQRTEVLDKCGGHLGHVFPDGPQPTGLRYCMNGAALIFVPDKALATSTKH